MRAFVGAAAALLALGTWAWFAADGFVAVLGGVVAILGALVLLTAITYRVIEPEAEDRVPRESVRRPRRRNTAATHAGQPRCGSCNRPLVDRRGVQVCAVCDHLAHADSG